MKKIVKVVLLVVMTMAVISSVFAQNEKEYSKEELLKEIAAEKQQIRELAKDFLIDTLPELMQRDPKAADQALAQYSGMFNAMDQNDFLYLLGHFYARMGENTRAISTFNSLLKTQLNDDARKMLNVVLYQQMVQYLQANDRKAAKDFLRAIVFENFNIDRYYPSYLYIWADMAADDGEYESVVSTLGSYDQNRGIITDKILPDKKAVLAKIQNIDLSAFYRDPSQSEHKKILAQVEGIKVDLTNVYNELISLKGIIYLDAIVALHKEEMGMLDSLKINITEYYSKKNSTESFVAEGYTKLQAIKAISVNYQKNIEVMDRILQIQYERFLAQDPTVVGKDYSDMELKRLYDIEKNLDFYNDAIAELDMDIADPSLASINQQLRNQRADFSERRTNLMIRKNDLNETRKHVNDIQEELFNAILTEYYELNRDKKDFDIQMAELEKFFAEETKDVFTDQMRQSLQAKVQTQIVLTANSTDRDEPIRQNVREINTVLDFIKLQLEYRNLHNKEVARLAKQGELSEQQLAQRQEEILGEKRELITRIQTFIAANPNFQAIEQPNDTFLISNADLYYNLAELQYSVDLQNPAIALDSYRKVVQIDPAFFELDAALYNIGFISSQLKHQQIDASKSRFYELNSTALTLDNASRYQQSDFAEALNAYQQVIDNYKESPLYDETLYRLGILNYYLATDADQPARYYAIALNCFNEIIDKPTSKYKYDAIYQRGWLRLNSTEEADLKLAMADFLALLNAVESGQISDPVLVQDYRDDAVDNIAYCLIALDGMDFNNKAKGVQELQNMFAGYSNQEVIRRVLDKAATNKFDLSASLQAVDFMWLKINMSPMALDNPALVDSILHIYAASKRDLREGQDFDLITQDIYLNIINNYGKDSFWYSTNKDKNITAQLAVIKNAYDKRSIRLYNEFLADPTNESKMLAYEQHMDQFGSFVELHGDGLAAWQKDSEKTRLLLCNTLAERSKLVKNYKLAIDNLHRYNAKYPEDEDFFLHEGLSYTYALNTYNLLESKISLPEYQPEPATPANADELFTLLSENSMRFIGVLRSEPYRTPEREREALTILLGLGDIQYNRGKFAEAKTIYLSALEQESSMDEASKFSVYGKLAFIADKDKDYATAEGYYRSALAFATTPADKEALKANINVQIQNSYDSADQSGNYAQAAAERLRLAAQLGATEAGKVQGLKMAAQESYVRAKEYQKAIDILLELAGTRTDINEVYYYYFRAAEIAEADTAMKNPELAETIRQSFIARHPSSNQAFSLRLAKIQAMEKRPAERTAAAEAYLQLHDEARNKTINIGDITPDALMINASINYREAGNKEKELEVYNKFLTLYPAHPNVIPYMQVIADDYLAKGDTLRFEQAAKDIYKKDKTKADRYQWVAANKLGKAYYAFDTAYRNKNYSEAFKQRDEFKKIEAAYVKEGLSFEGSSINIPDINTYFAAVQKEFDDIQKRNAFLKSFDIQLAAIEKGELLTAAPSKLISVNANTTWEKHLIAGNYKRIPNFKALVVAEVKKVNKVLEAANATEYEIENSRRLRAQDIIARIYQKGVTTINTQVGVYVRTSVETVGLRQEYKGDALTTLIASVAGQQSNDLLDLEYATRLNIYNLYHLAGYKDTYTERSFARLQEWGWVPDYKVDEYPLDSGWVQKLDDSPTNLTIQSTVSPKGINLGGVVIPSNRKLKLNRAITAKIVPDFSLLHLVYPYDIKIILNGTVIESGVVATDTLDASKPVTTTRYAYLLPPSAWAEGQNIIELEIPNTSPELQPLNLSLQVYTDKRRLYESVPSETVMIYTDTSWRIVTKNADSGEEQTSPAIYATNFGITNDKIDGMENTAAKPIWLSEEAPVSPVVFEVDFYLDTEFKEGLIDFVAPENAAISLNGTELATNLAFDYDPEPFQVYSSQVAIDKTKVVNGKNTLRFTISNNSSYRGMLAAIKIIKAGKEDIR